MTLQSIFKRNDRKSASRRRMDAATQTNARAVTFNHWQRNLGTPAPTSFGTGHRI